MVEFWANTCMVEFLNWKWQRLPKVPFQVQIYGSESPTVGGAVPPYIWPLAVAVLLVNCPLDKNPNICSFRGWQFKSLDILLVSNEVGILTIFRVLASNEKSEWPNSSNHSPWTPPDIIQKTCGFWNEDADGLWWNLYDIYNPIRKTNLQSLEFLKLSHVLRHIIYYLISPLLGRFHINDQFFQFRKFLKSCRSWNSPLECHFHFQRI